MPDSWERQVIANLNKIRRQSCSRTEKKTPTAVCTFLSVPFFFGVGRGRQSEGSTAGTARKSPERPWTAARTIEVLRRCPLAFAQRLVHCAIAVSTAVLGQSHKDNVRCTVVDEQLGQLKQRKSNLLSPAPPPYSWSLLGKFEGPAPPPSSKISWSFDLAWNLECVPNGLLVFSGWRTWEWLEAKVETLPRWGLRQMEPWRGIHPLSSALRVRWWSPATRLTPSPAKSSWWGGPTPCLRWTSLQSKSKTAAAK